MRLYTFEVNVFFWIYLTLTSFWWNFLIAMEAKMSSSIFLSHPFFEIGWRFLWHWIFFRNEWKEVSKVTFVSTFHFGHVRTLRNWRKWEFCVKRTQKKMRFRAIRFQVGLFSFLEVRSYAGWLVCCRNAIFYARKFQKGYLHWMTF